ncbi:hypothetical protein BAUCODRAFT_351061 [Baudoinia panamericana UAMH 10762]|uniref:Uncharacterized protein n=1 Tax=Baudoinia panamericana (strain UAMH 10762) TaxID=717646 RepID=M2N6S4_BAUPA|nr:uncharacterized protein BAUCODRAFT_351061 [Baudoinia panamericana UAMH 10762]EMC99798.1 hypothetical protein BAUCODRAFT_351061 [Baudoinia panamericana UAMH 10762]
MVNTDEPKGRKTCFCNAGRSVSWMGGSTYSSRLRCQREEGGSHIVSCQERNNRRRNLPLSVAGVNRRQGTLNVTTRESS